MQTGGFHTMLEYLGHQTSVKLVEHNRAPIMCREACYAVVGLQTRVKYDPCPRVCPYRLRRETAVKA